MSKTINVRFKENQGAEDLFFCPDTRKVYVRQPVDDYRVCWLTATKWSGGYEATAPVKSDVWFNIITPGSRTYRKEHILDEHYALKQMPFSYEQLKELAEEIRDKKHLEEHSRWFTWLLLQKTKYKYDGYDDNWIYCSSIEKKRSELDYFHIVGNKKVVLVETTYIHKYTKQEWIEYALYEHAPILSVCLEIVGYKFKR